MVLSDVSPVRFANQVWERVALQDLHLEWNCPRAAEVRVEAFRLARFAKHGLSDTPWESFDHASDVLLELMCITYGLNNACEILSGGEPSSDLLGLVYAAASARIRLHHRSDISPCELAALTGRLRSEVDTLRVAGERLVRGELAHAWMKTLHPLG